MNDKKSIIDPALPLIDLHRHLDGNVRLETIIDLADQHNLEIPASEVDELRPYVQVVEPQPGVMAFIKKFELMRMVLVDYDACRRISYENVEDAREEGLDYVELRFSPWFMAERSKLDPVGIVEAVCEGISSGVKETGIGVKLIGILSRTYGPEVAWKELDALISHHESLVGLDLAGDEANFPAELFEDHFKKARDLGLSVTVHAGESDGAKSIWQAITMLGASRIGHAVSAVDDIDLLDYMLEHNIGIECNLTSNIQTSTVKSYSDHPIKKFLEIGLLATINTDDPGISGIDIHHEYNFAAPAVGLDCEQIRKAQRNALKIAFLSEDEKIDLILKKANIR
jgi:adenosine deaminase